MSKYEAIGDTIRVYSSLTIGEVSLVDDPGCPGADVVIIKARKAQSENGVAENAVDSAEDCGEIPVNDEQTRTEIRKRLAPLTDARVALVQGNLDVEVFKAKAAETIDDLEQRAQAGDLISKQAAGIASSILSETDMNLDQIEAALSEAEGKITAVEKRAETAEAENIVLKARAETAEAELELVRKGKPTAEDADEAVLKGLPAAAADLVRKARADAATARADADAARAERAAETDKVEKSRRSGELAKAGIKDAETVADAMVAVAKAMPESAKVIDAAFAAVAKELATSAVFKSYGSASATMFDGDPEMVLKAKADELRAADKSLSAEAAYEAAVQAMPEAYDAYTAKRRSGATVN